MHRDKGGLKKKKKKKPMAGRGGRGGTLQVLISRCDSTAEDAALAAREARSACTGLKELGTMALYLKSFLEAARDFINELIDNDESRRAFLLLEDALANCCTIAGRCKRLGKGGTSILAAYISADLQRSKASIRQALENISTSALSGARGRPGRTLAVALDELRPGETWTESQAHAMEYARRFGSDFIRLRESLRFSWAPEVGGLPSAEQVKELRKEIERARKEREEECQRLEQIVAALDIDSTRNSRSFGDPSESGENRKRAQWRRGPFDGIHFSLSSNLAGMISLPFSLSLFLCLTIKHNLNRFRGRRQW